MIPFSGKQFIKCNYHSTYSISALIIFIYEILKTTSPNVRRCAIKWSPSYHNQLLWWENIFWFFSFDTIFPWTFKYHDQSSLLKILIPMSYGIKFFKIYIRFYCWIQSWKIKYLYDGLFNVFHMTPPKQHSTITKGHLCPLIFMLMLW
jgi:hypothetical protein